ncbi:MULTISPECIES: ligase-associated DNA damage response DEXH box helicase [unclassified Caballeronia]|uniref:ligase-associated DNA damage response DEXH box helicase n=1 Tax=unclassified Caballeronia TaxID=2646786 RepID=UPI002864959C|nr:MULTISPECIES: ligase-associated DNA damage response DEXH box helicase [unclassified Caballeronia]MDR5770693.1 ligase-associated DNA damage response DEXH box helicase [Caballeronia sp. LZ002]MDR5846130.1 ligase-associated DNA damage response DEXH box helicase [Caballeronia sp. LZ003]
MSELDDADGIDTPDTPDTSARSRRRAPRPRRVPRTQAAQAKLDAAADLFKPAPFEYDAQEAAKPMDERITRWFDSRGWQPFEFQREVWHEIERGASGLLHATTGAGKTWAVWLGALAAYAGPPKPKAGAKRKGKTAGNSRLDEKGRVLAVADPEDSAQSTAKTADRVATITDKTPLPAPLTVLWITPMRALAADTARALQTAVTALSVPWTVGLRTGDTSSTERSRQNRRMPSALVTTPESLTLMLTRANAREELAHVRLVVVDEWHELLGNKRGTQTQLAFARLARWRPEVQIWGLSATLGNLALAHDALLHPVRTPRVIVRGAQPKTLVVDTLIPETIERFPWGGHLGVRQVGPVADEIEHAQSSLVFTNTRSQSEIWYRALLELKPEWAGLIALHHGSLDKEVRDWVELGLKNGQLKAVVCTSSLDLGVDFLPVDRVFQIGSPKGVARLMQRAGRSGHAPGRVSRVTIVPTHALELVEAAAARWAIGERRIEGRDMPLKPLDVLVQHLVTVAIGGGFTPADMFDEVRTAYAYRDLTQAEFDWALAFVERGGTSLSAYPDYHRVVHGDDGVYRVPREDLVRRHRNNVGTIVANATISVAYMTGGRIGAMEESFISRLKPGDVFTFGGRALELVRVRDMTAYVKRATSSRGAMPQWAGSKMPLSSELSEAALVMLARANDGIYDEPEMRAVQPLLDLQAKWSALPGPGVLVVESVRSREGHHFFCYPFAGRMAHIGLGSLIGWRVARDQPSTFSISMNDYGFELLSARPFDWETLIEEGLFSAENLEHDILASLNASELSARRFREIARVSGLIYQGHPGQQKSARQLQASSGLFYEVFRKHDSGNLLLTQADQEVMLQELELGRIRAALQRMSESRLALTHPKKPTPFAFPLIIARLREKVSTEKLSDRVERMLADLEKAAQA